MDVSLKSHDMGRALAAFVLLLLFAIIVPQQAMADGFRPLLSSEVRIHVLPFSYNDAIVIECNGHFGVVDSGEDNDYPDGSDPRYPAREGTIINGGHEREIIAYMAKIGVTQDNLDFYIGTHPHSDHIGSAPAIIREFHPRAIYLPVYEDNLITDETKLWDNQFVYDKFLDAAKWAQDAYGARFIQHLNPSYVDADDSDKGSPVFMLGDAKIEILNYDEMYLQTKVPDANYFSYGVKVTAANGRSAFLAGDINNYTDGDGNGIGDEDRLKDIVGPVDLLKMGHHGTWGSNTPEYLRSVLKQAKDEDACVVVQTGEFSILSQETLGIINEKRARIFSATDMPTMGRDAFVADLTIDGVKTNAQDDAKPILQERDASPRAVFYLDGLPHETLGWHEGKSGRLYYFGDPDSDSGSAYALTNCWATLDGMRVYIDKNGDLIRYPHNDSSKPDAPDAEDGKRTGWYRGDSNWFYYDKNGSLVTGWLHDNRNWYYLRDSGAMATGWEYVGNAWYHMGGSGAMQTGWILTDNHWFFLEPSGSMHVGWLFDRGSWYYLCESGAMATGWEQVQGVWYLMNASGAMQIGWQNLYGMWYFLNASGAMQTGWLYDNGTWYRLRDSGAMVTGWDYVGNDWYYMSGSGAMQTGWVFSKGKWYYLDASGSMAKGWRAVGGTWYYLDASDGVMQTGMKDVNGKTYCLGSSGAMLTGWQKSKDTWYFFDESGAMQKDRWVGNYYVGADGSMATSQWIGQYHVNGYGVWDATNPSKGVVSSLQ